MKFHKMLNEERLHSKDKRAIMGFMKIPPKSKTAHKMQSGDLFKVEPTKDGVKFIYDKDDFEFLTTLVDISDSLGGYKFDSKPGKFTVKVKG